MKKVDFCNLLKKVYLEKFGPLLDDLLVLIPGYLTKVIKQKNPMGIFLRMKPRFSYYVINGSTFCKVFFLVLLWCVQKLANVRQIVHRYDITNKFRSDILTIAVNIHGGNEAYKLEGRWYSLTRNINRSYLAAELAKAVTSS